MATYMSMDNLRFILHEVLHISDLFELDRYKDFDSDAVDLLLESAKDWADQDWYPHFREMDEKPAVFKEGKIHSHPIIRTIFQKAGENGWLGMYFDDKYGAMQAPITLSNSVNHIFESANNHLNGYLGLTSGSAHLITTFGTPELADRFVPQMLSGQWGGTMCLTEPQAGSSLGDITTSAKEQDGGFYKVKGQKIFISGGDHQGTDNFVHLTLARIEGAPEGTRGISLFVIPQHREENGGMVFNDVVTAGEFQKLGQRGYSTVHLVFGENDDCHGWLVGEPNMGLKYMFQMMNHARIDVGMTAASTASAAYYASLQYAKERAQGRKVYNNKEVKSSDEEPALIIRHADVRRMLMFQKSVVEGSVSFLLEVSMYHDYAHYGPAESKDKYSALTDLLTPITKAFPTEYGKKAVDYGLQVLGGYGYCTDFVLQQYYRDIRIMSIYEGTTGIQAMDLLGRKVPQDQGKALMYLMQDVNGTIEKARNSEALTKYGDKLEEAMKLIQDVLIRLSAKAQSGRIESYLADANVFLDMMSLAVIAHQWLKMGIIAEEKLKEGNGKFDQQFYKSKIETMKYFFKYELTQVESCYQILLNADEVTLENQDLEILI